MHDLTNILAQMHAMMNSLHGSPSVEHLRESTWQPPVDIYEAEDRIMIVVELPGVHKDEIDVDIVEGVLRISGSKPKALPESTRHVHQMEIPYGRFARFVRLPCAVNVDTIQAEYTDGYLTVTVPRGSSDGK